MSRTIEQVEKYFAYAANKVMEFNGKDFEQFTKWNNICIAYDKEIKDLKVQKEIEMEKVRVAEQVEKQGEVEKFSDEDLAPGAVIVLEVPDWAKPKEKYVPPQKRITKQGKELVPPTYEELQNLPDFSTPEKEMMHKMRVEDEELTDMSKRALWNLVKSVLRDTETPAGIEKAMKCYMYREYDEYLEHGIKNRYNFKISDDPSCCARCACKDGDCEYLEAENTKTVEVEPEQGIYFAPIEEDSSDEDSEKIVPVTWEDLEQINIIEPLENNDAPQEDRKENLQISNFVIDSELIATVIKNARIWVNRRKVAFPARKFSGTPTYYTSAKTLKDSALVCCTKMQDFKEIYIGGVRFLEMRQARESDGRLKFQDWFWDVNLHNIGQILKSLGYIGFEENQMVHHHWRWEDINDGILNIAAAIFKDLKFPHDTEAEMMEIMEQPESYPTPVWSVTAPQKPDYTQPGGNAGSSQWPNRGNSAGTSPWPNSAPITEAPIGWPKETVDRQGILDDWTEAGRRSNPSGKDLQAAYGYKAHFDEDYRTQIYLMRQITNHNQLGIELLLGANDRELWRLEALRQIALDSRQLMVDIRSGNRPSLESIMRAIEKINSSATGGQGPRPGTNAGHDRWPDRKPEDRPPTLPPRPQPESGAGTSNNGKQPMNPYEPYPIPGGYGMDADEKSWYEDVSRQGSTEPKGRKWTMKTKYERGESSRGNIVSGAPGKAPQAGKAEVRKTAEADYQKVFRNPLGRNHEDKKFRDGIENKTTTERGNVPLNESSSARDNDVVHTLQRDVDVVEETEVYRYSSQNPEKGWQASEMLERPILVKSEKWSCSGDKSAPGNILVKMNLPESWMAVGKNRIDNHAARATFSHALHRFDMCLRIHVNSTHFYGGRLVLFFDFLGQHSLSGRIMTRELASTMFNVEIDVSVGNEAELIVPYENIAPYISNVDSWFDNGYLGTAYVMIQNRLAAPPTCTQEIGVRVYCHAINAELKVIRSWDPKAYPQPAVVERQGREQSHGKRATAGLYSMANVDDALYKLALENVPSKRMNMLQKYNTNVRELCFKDSLLRVADWTSSQGIDGALITIPVHPCVPVKAPVGESSGLVHHTIIEAVSDAYCMWRGSLNYRVTVSASQFHSGRLALVFFPGCYSKSKLQQLKNGWEQNPHMVMDIKEKHENDFFVPYVSTRSWNLTSVHASGGDYVATSTGYLYMFILEPLIAPELAAGKVEVNLYISAGPDFELSVPRAILPDKEFAPVGVLQGMNDQFDEYQVIGRMDQIGRAPQDLQREDFMNLHKLLMRYGKLVSRSGKSNFFCFPVAPHLWASNPEWKCHMSWFSKFFTFWQGSLRFKISFRRNYPMIASFMHNRPLFLKIWHDPTMTLPDGATDMIGKLSHSRSSGYGSQLIELNMECVCEIEVPFYSQYDRLFIRREEHKRDDKLPLLSSHNGCVCISASDIVDINIAVSIAAGNDFLFSVPNGVAPTKPSSAPAMFELDPRSNENTGEAVLPARDFQWGWSSLDDSPYENENNQTIVPRGRDAKVVPLPQEYVQRQGRRSSWETRKAEMMKEAIATIDPEEKELELCPLGSHIYERDFGGEGMRQETYNLYGEQAREVDYALGEEVDAQEDEYRDGFSGYEPIEEEEMTIERREELRELAIPENTWFDLQAGDEEDRAVYQAAHPFEQSLTNWLDLAVEQTELTVEMRNDFEQMVLENRGDDTGVTFILEHSQFELGWSRGDLLVRMDGEEVFDSTADSEIQQIDWDSEEGEERIREDIDVGEDYVRLNTSNGRLTNLYDEAIRVELFEQIQNWRDDNDESQEEFSFSIVSAIGNECIARGLMHRSLHSEHYISTVCVRAIVDQLRRDPSIWHYQIMLGEITFCEDEGDIIAHGCVENSFVRIGDYVFNTGSSGMFRIGSSHNNVWY